jgi:hypothetical protein
MSWLSNEIFVGKLLEDELLQSRVEGVPLDLPDSSVLPQKDSLHLQLDDAP